MKGLRIHSQGRKEIAKIDLFVTRSPYHPNPRGVTVMKMLERRGVDANCYYYSIMEESHYSQSDSILLLTKGL